MISPITTLGVVAASFVQSISMSSNVAIGQQNAVKEARIYLVFKSFSRKGLYNQLTSEYGSGYTDNEAIYAINNLELNNLVDWNKQASKCAENYLKFSSFLRSQLYEQLASTYGGQFTKEQAEYALKYVGY